MNPCTVPYTRRCHVQGAEGSRTHVVATATRRQVEVVSAADVDHAEELLSGGVIHSWCRVSRSPFSFPPLHPPFSRSLISSPLVPLDPNRSSAAASDLFSSTDVGPDLETSHVRSVHRGKGGGGGARGEVGCRLHPDVSSTLERLHFRALRVHVGVVQRVAGRVADGRQRVLWRVKSV